MGKGDIGWKRRTDEGEKREVTAKKIGKIWKFSIREKRFDSWTELKSPPLEDWELLLDAVRRRISRKLIPKKEEQLLIKTILQHFPDACL